ncbi:g1455 [Coccomyxa viridis]|uniref:G1455 protein n=1 Tax=Coccomyxa viridis TaxID=1274662 RepID=A0ABP1FNG8_9CHLO
MLHATSKQAEAEVQSGGRRGNTEQDSSGNGARPEPPIDRLMTFLLFIFPALGGLLFGYDIGATSGALVSLKSAVTSGTTWYDLDSFQSGLVVSSSLFGALAGSSAAFVVGDKLGRRRELLLAAVLYGGSSVVMGAAPGLEILVLGRALYGLGIGFAMHAAPAYIAEAAPAKVRGTLISLKEVLVVCGILLGYLGSYLFVDTVGGWRLMYGASAVPAVILLGGMFWLPDSPRWLLLSGAGKSRAEKDLVRARGSTADAAAVQRELAGIEKSVREAQATEIPGFVGLFKGRYLRPLTVGTSLMLFQQITGQPSVLYYAADIFNKAGIGAGKDATGVSVILGVFKLVMTGVAVLTVESLGRRPLLLIGVSSMVVSLLALAGSQLALTGQLETWTSVIALLLYVGAYQVSFGPISWLIVGEIFPLAVRGQAAALATVTNFGSNFLVSLVLPTVQETFGAGATYLGFAVIGVAAVATIYAIVPETKGKSLEEIEALFDLESDEKTV